MKKLLILLLIMLALPLVCATKFVEYEAYEGVITPNGNLVATTQGTPAPETTETILRSEFSGKYGIRTGSYMHRKYNWYERMFFNKDNRHNFIAANDELKVSIKTKYSKEEPLQVDKITNREILDSINTKVYYDFVDLSALHPKHTATVFFFKINGNDLNYAYKKVAGKDWEKWDAGKDNKCEKDNDNYLICEVARNIEAVAVIDNTDLNPLEEFDMIGYKCEDNTCSELGDQVWEQESDNNHITARYPSTDRANKKYSYGLYFYKPGFITWEQNDYYNGKGDDTQTNPGKTKQIFFTKKQGASAPIEDLKVKNTAYSNMPVMIDVEVNIDSKTYSALRHSGPLEAVPEELKEYYQVETDVTLQVVNHETLQTVRTLQTKIDIPFSGSEKISFEWTPREGQTGLFDIVVSTDISDSEEKIDQDTKILQSTSKTIQIIEDIENLKDTCYTILNNLETSDQFPDEHTEIEISATKISNYMDEFGYLTPLDTQVIVQVFDENQVEVYTETIYLDENQDTFTPESFSTEIDDYIAGQYTIQLTGIATDPICNDKENIQDIISIGMIVRGDPSTGNHAPTIFIPDQTLAVGEKIYLNMYAHANDQDNDHLQFNIVARPDNNIVTLGLYEIDEYTFSLTGVARGTTSMNIEVSDGELSARHLFTITVTQDPVNNLPPVITSDPIKQAKEDIDYIYDVEATDPEGDQLTYYLEQSPEGMTIDPYTGLIEYTPKETGKYNVRIRVHDGYNDVYQSYILHVSIEYTKKHLFTISSELDAVNTVAQPGEYAINYILLRNIGQEPEKHIKVKATIPEIGFSQQVIQELTLGPHDTKWVPIMFKVPKKKPGTYLFVVEIGNKYYSTIKYGTITIENKASNSNDKYLLV